MPWNPAPCPPSMVLGAPSTARDIMLPRLCLHGTSVPLREQMSPRLPSHHPPAPAPFPSSPCHVCSLRRTSPQTEGVREIRVTFPVTYFEMTRTKNFTQGNACHPERMCLQRLRARVFWNRQDWASHAQERFPGPGGTGAAAVLACGDSCALEKRSGSSPTGEWLSWRCVWSCPPVMQHD